MVSAAVTEMPPGCAERGGPLAARAWEQPALFFHGGYGETTRTEVVRCPMCGWWRSCIVAAVRPR